MEKIVANSLEEIYNKFILVFCKMTDQTLFLSLAPNLEERGHGIVYQNCLEEAAKSLNFSFQALFPFHLSLCPYKESWTPFFSQNRLLDFAKAFRKKEKKILFMESFSGTDLFFFTLASLFFFRKTDRIALLFRYGLTNKKTLYVFLCKALIAKMGKKCLLFTDSELIAREFDPYLRTSLTVLPIPHTERVEPKKNSSSKLFCWWPGAPRMAKGLQEIERFANHPERCRFGIELIVARSSAIANATLIKDVLSREEYLLHLQQSDFILLPYNPIIYKSGTSGIFVEAVVAGKIPLVKAGSWLAYELKKHNLTELIVNWEEEGLFKKIVALKEDPIVLNKLAAMRTAYLAFHTQERFTKALALKMI